MGNKNTQDNAMLTRLCFKLLPVQIMVVAMGSINSIVDCVAAGRFVSAEAVGVIGLYYSMVNILPLWVLSFWVVLPCFVAGTWEAAA